MPRNLDGKLREVKSIFRENSNFPKIPIQRQSNSPIWLNSFLSVMVPSCLLDTYDPAIIHHHGRESLRQEFIGFTKKYQTRIMRNQILSSFIIISASVGVCFFLVNHSNFNYFPNIYFNSRFWTFCLVLWGLGLTSLLFVIDIDIYGLLRLNGTSNSGFSYWKAIFKIFVTFATIGIAVR